MHRITARLGLAAAAALAAFSLGACTVSVTDEQVFNPPERAALVPASTGQALAVEGEDTLPAGFRISHGFTDTPGGRIAYSFARKIEGEGAGQRPVGLVCMGNSSDRRTDAIDYFEELLPHADVLTFDYPGYGASSGEPSVPNLDAAANSMLDLLPSLGVVSSRPVFAWGHSLGGFVCGQITGRSDRIAGLALLATLPDATSAAKAFTPWYAGPFVRYDIQGNLKDYDTVAALADFEGPIMALVPRGDDFFPPPLQYAYVEALSEQGNDVELVDLADAEHSGFDNHPDFDSIVARFVARVEATR